MKVINLNVNDLCLKRYDLLSMKNSADFSLNYSMVNMSTFGLSPEFLSISSTFLLLPLDCPRRLASSSHVAPPVSQQTRACHY